MKDQGSRADRPFAGDTAGCYARYRRSYPAEFVSRLREFSQGGRGRLLDLGCGTGQLALQLAPLFLQAVGIDPEPDMLREAERLARERGIGNVEWISGGSRELKTLEPMIGEFDLVTIGTAFHFMEPHATLSELRLVAPHGVVAVAYNGTPMWLQPDPWAKALRSVLESRLGELSEDDFTRDALRAAEDAMHHLGYVQVERWEQISAERISVDFVVGHILSAISTGQISPTEREQFAQELAAAVVAVEPSGHVIESVAVRAIIGGTDR